MKIVIDVPEGMLEAIKDGTWCGSHKLEIAIRNGIPYKEQPTGEWIEIKHRLNLLIGVLYTNQLISDSDIDYIEDSIKKLMKGEEE